MLVKLNTPEFYSREDGHCDAVEAAVTNEPENLNIYVPSTEFQMLNDATKFIATHTYPSSSQVKHSRLNVIGRSRRNYEKKMDK